MSHHTQSKIEQQHFQRPQLIPAINVATTEPTVVATLSEELNAYSKRKYDEERWTAKSKLEFDGIFDTFIDVVGDKPVSEIKKADIQQFADVVNHLPPNRKKMPNFRRLTAKQAAEKNRLISGDRLSVLQRKKYFTILSPVFNEFVDEGMIEFNFFNK